LINDDVVKGILYRLSPIGRYNLPLISSCTTAIASILLTQLLIILSIKFNI